jgi:hypothetical protein
MRGGGCVGMIIWVCYEFGYGVAAFDEFVGQLTWDKQEVLLELLWCDISSMSDLLI